MCFSCLKKKIREKQEREQGWNNQWGGGWGAATQWDQPKKGNKGGGSGKS